MRDPYYDLSGVSASGINRFRNDSPLHYWLESPFNSERKPTEETPALVMGRLAHAMALTPELVGKEFVIQPEINRRTNEGKAEHAAFIESNAGTTIVTRDQWETCEKMRDALQAHSTIRQLLGQGSPEEPVTWRREDGPLLCKAKLDYVRNGLVVDYKTTTSTRADKLSRTIAEYGYHRQGAWYIDAAEKHHGERPRGVVLIFQNKEVPDDIGIFALDSEALQLGEQQCARTYEDICKRMETMDWRSHPPEIQDISLPGWYVKYN